MLFTKCAATLASSRSWVLITLPLTAVLQVTIPPRFLLYMILMLSFLNSLLNLFILLFGFSS
jgi:hypothetical protein